MRHVFLLAAVGGCIAASAFAGLAHAQAFPEGGMEQAPDGSSTALNLVCNGVGHKMTLKDVATIAEETKMSPTGEYRPSWPSLTSALRAITNWRAGELDLRKLGLWLRDHHGRVVGGLRIAKNTTSKTTYWYIDGPTAAGKWK